VRYVFLRLRVTAKAPNAAASKASEPGSGTPVGATTGGEPTLINPPSTPWVKSNTLSPGLESVILNCTCSVVRSDAKRSLKSVGSVDEKKPVSSRLLRKPVENPPPAAPPVDVVSSVATVLELPKLKEIVKPAIVIGFVQHHGHPIAKALNEVVRSRGDNRVGEQQGPVRLSPGSPETANASNEPSPLVK
jgi:hypothetical protein